MSEAFVILVSTRSRLNWRAYRACLSLPLTWALTTRIRFHFKRNFFVTDTAIVHPYTMKTMTENTTFWKRSPEWNFLKTLFNRFRVDRQKGNYSKTLTSHHQFQAKTIGIQYRVDANFLKAKFKSCILKWKRIRVDRRKRYEYDTVRTRIFLKTEIKSCVFKWKRLYLWSRPYSVNLIRWLVDLATKWLSCARKHARKTNSNTRACEVHPFRAIQGKSIGRLLNPTLNFTQRNDIALVTSRFLWYHFSREI